MPTVQRTVARVVESQQMGARGTRRRGSCARINTAGVFLSGAASPSPPSPGLRPTTPYSGLLRPFKKVYKRCCKDAVQDSYATRLTKIMCRYIESGVCASREFLGNCTRPPRSDISYIPDCGHLLSRNKMTSKTMDAAQALLRPSPATSTTVAHSALARQVRIFSIYKTTSAAPILLLSNKKQFV